MNALITKTLFICCIATLMTGCKLALMVTADGDVSSSSGTRDCAGGTICEFEITDTDFSDTFTIIAREGYVFSKWQAGDRYLCGNSTNPVCVVSNVPASGIPGVDVFILTGTYFYAKPVFTFVGIDTDDDGTKDYLDEDDDNDGVLDGYDDCPIAAPDLDGSGCPFILDWSGAAFSSELLGVKSINIDGELYDVSFRTGSADDSFFDSNTQSYNFTFETLESALSASEVLSAHLTIKKVFTNLINGISYFGSGDILTPYGTDLKDTVNGPRYSMLAVTSRGTQVPYPDGDTSWVTSEASGYYADVLHPNSWAVWEPSP